jgi:ribosomal protein S18 acetylase RimI-like enzyme
MYEIRSLREGDIQDFIHCNLLVWKSLKRILPSELIEDEINKLKNANRKVNIKNPIEDPKRINLIAIENESIVGFVFGRIVRNSLSWLRFLGVHPEHRRRGIGKSLVDRYIVQSKVRGAKKISLYAPTILKNASKLYENLGFRSEGLRERHIYGIDLMVYSKNIVTTNNI